MHLISSAAIVLLIALGPWLVLTLTKHIKPLGFVGPIFLCYLLGIGFSFIFGALGWNTGLAETIYSVLIPIAIPLILFSTDLRSLKKLAVPTLISFLLVVVSVFAVSCGAFFLLGDTIEAPAGVSGMLIGLYTGGTPNLYAIGSAVNVSTDTQTLANTCDIVVGGLYFLILLAAGPLISRKRAEISANDADNTLTDELSSQYAADDKALSFNSLLRRVPALLLAVLCLGVGFGLSVLWGVPDDNLIIIIMLTVTTLGIALSFIKPVRNAPGTFATGQYLIYMFSIGIGLTFDLRAIGSNLLSLFIYIAAVQFGSIALHYILAALCRIDAGTTVITSVAGVFGPAFIVPVANAMKNRDVVVPGLICGILGYAIGNYLGIGTALLLASVF